MSAPEPAPPKRTTSSLIVKILIGLLIVVGLVFAYGVMLPDDFLVQRSATMAAPPDAVFAQINDFHNWERWSPWAKLDPNARNAFEGPDAGEGAVFRWSGNSKVGEGAMTILDVTPDERIKLRLDFEKPMKDTSDVEFVFQPEGEKTVVTWTMSGKHQNVIGKLMCQMMNMDKMIGGDFEKGLASIKDIVEKQP